MRNLIYFISIFIFLSCNAYQLADRSQDDLYNTIEKVIELYNTKNTAEMNHLIHPDLGVYLLTRLGVYNDWKLKKDICLSEECMDDYKISLVYRKKLQNQRFEKKILITKSNELIIDCENVTKEGGFIVNNYKTSNLLSSIIENKKRTLELEGISFSISDYKNDLANAKKIEKESIRVVITEYSESFYGNSFVFYLTYIKDKWYLSIIDFVTSDCSA